MKKLFHKTAVWELLIIFVLSLTPLLWFRQGTMMLGHDNVFPIEPREFLAGRLTTWSPHGFGQNQSLIMGTIAIHLIDALPYLAGLSTIATQKVVYVFWFFMIGISMYTLVKTLGKSGLFAIVATMIYQFNFFILQGWWIGERTKFSAYIALPLVLSVFFLVYKKKLSVLAGSAANSLILFVFNAGGLYGIPLFGGFFISLGIFLILFTGIAAQTSVRESMRLVILAFGTLLGSMVLNAYYLLPAVSKLLMQYASGIESQGGVSGLIDWAQEISANSSFMNLFRLQGIAEWYDNPEHPYAKYFLTNPWLILASFVWPLLVLLAARRAKDKEQRIITTYFLLVYLVGMLFAAGTHPPLGFIYIFLVKTVPGFGIFRTPYFKFAPAMFLAVSFLAASAIDQLPKTIKKWGFLLFAAFILLYHFPFFTGEFFSWRKGFSTRLTVPTYVSDFGNWLSRGEHDDTRVLMLPPNNPDLRYSMYDWGYLSFQSIATLVSNHPVIINNDRINEEEKALVLTLYQAIADRNKELFLDLTSALRIGYLVIQHDAASDGKTDLVMDASVYKSILEKDLQLSPVRSFGRWTMYSTGVDPLPAIVLAPSVNRLNSLSDDVGKYYTFSNNPFFVRYDDIPSSLPIPETGQYIIADCLNCKAKDKPFIKIAERNILPSSPLYPFMLWNENRRLHMGDPKSLIYDYLGISLKRVGEIRELIKENKPIPSPALGRFISLMESIAETFTTLSKYEDKIDVGDDVQFYLESERNVLAELLGIYVISGDQVNALGQVTQAISSTLRAIEPYVFIPDQMTHRLYQIKLDHAGAPSFYINSADFLTLGKDEVTISLSVDQKTVAEKRLRVTQEPSWIEFGSQQLTAGTHYLMLTYPEPPNMISSFEVTATEFSTSSDVNCFTSSIVNFDYRKLYRVKVNYTNNFSSELFFNIWEFAGNTKRLKNVFRLPPSQVKGELVRFIKSYADTEGVQIGFCSRDLSEDLMEKNTSVVVNELIYPTVFLAAQMEQPFQTFPVQAKKINITSYEVSFTTTTENAMLVFFDRYDAGWQLTGFEKNHIRMNGYANGWLIEKPGSYNATLTFGPQENFVAGVRITGFGVLIAVALLLWERRRRHRYETQ
ncbi:MAG: hypothetical protein UY16_C0005G0019 [Candidatus Gottesmanbacteria bacterium GW2011_GWA2_47_9]|uniref:Membrane protein YfhO n=2 Tax=Microgenomates group TaxID=1794810 RepID=A0A0G1U3C2_9BACT|nr:MAG: hypothetical protein UV66_C0008G0002 [Candidatus Woesebacteria bacterium GW2011_GWA1_43_12]KKU88576.1 MAG: hypothetical protein UY16_C0005G0019 [Candidatus Gottesmanbacteria bacterium GW2011_GWA2_47_9]